MKKYCAKELFDHLNNKEIQVLYSVLSHSCAHQVDSIGKNHFHIEFLFKHKLTKQDLSVLHQIQDKADVPLLCAFIDIASAVSNEHLDFLKDIFSLYQLSNSASILEDRVFISGKNANLLFDWKEELKKRLEFKVDKEFLKRQKRIEQDRI